MINSQQIRSNSTGMGIQCGHAARAVKGAYSLIFHWPLTSVKHLQSRKSSDLHVRILKVLPNNMFRINAVITEIAGSTMAASSSKVRG